MNQDTIDINELIPDDHNFNKGTEEGAALMDKSFKEHGAGRSILIDKDGRIIAGNKSQRAAIAAGIKKVRVIETTGDELVAVKRTDISLDSKEGREMALADNVTTQVNLAWDEVELKAVAAEVEGFDPEAWGVEGICLGDAEEETPVVEDDFDEEKDHVEARAALGDVWILGDHRLVCGDSTDAAYIALLLGQERADLCFTDPPYGIDYSGGRTQVVGKKDYGKLKNDNLQGEALGHLICNVFKFNKEGADVYICVSPIMQKPFLDYIEQEGKKVNAVIVWDKKAPGLGYMAYRRQCEFILFVKGGAFHKGDKSDIDLWRIGKDDATTYVHGTQKPVGVSGRAIENSSKKGDIVLDYFGGSGSTLIACEQLGRKARLMELDPHYCDVILARWEKHTGKKATKETNNQ